MEALKRGNFPCSFALFFIKLQFWYAATCEILQAFYLLVTSTNLPPGNFSGFAETLILAALQIGSLGYTATVREGVEQKWKPRILSNKNIYKVFENLTTCMD